MSRHDKLLELVEAVHRFPIPQPGGSHESMVEFDRQRMIKDSLLEQIIATCVETAERRPAAPGRVGPRRWRSRRRQTRRRRRRLGRRAARPCWPATPPPSPDIGPSSSSGSPQQELLYVPLAKGGKPRRIVRARTPGPIARRPARLAAAAGPRFAKRANCSMSPKTMEAEHPVGPGAVTEYDRLFTSGYQAIVRCLVASADDWDDEREPRQSLRKSNVRPSDTMLVEALQDLTESQLNRWLTHSRTLRLSVVERLSDRSRMASVRRVRRALRRRPVHAKVPQPGQPARDSAPARRRLALEPGTGCRRTGRLRLVTELGERHPARGSGQVAHDRHRSDRRELPRVPRLQHHDHPLRPRRDALHARRFSAPAGRATTAWPGT